MLNIDIQSIPSTEQRYDTLGDYYYSGDNWVVRVSETGEWKSEFLVALHELIEMALTKARGISEERIKQFDENFKGEGEPGNSKDAPYQDEHLFATEMEKLVAKELDLPWKKYVARLEKVPDKFPLVTL